jgi:hypothetical protein
VHGGGGCLVGGKCLDGNSTHLLRGVHYQIRYLLHHQMKLSCID